MGLGSSLSDMFLGSSAPEQSDASKQATAELWKIYQQAYNVRPTWNGKAWVIPQGAIQRFQMLLPMLQAQITAGRAGQGQQGQGQGGIVQGMLGGGIKSLGEDIGKGLGGWGGVGKKLMGLLPSSPTSVTGGLSSPGNMPSSQIQPETGGGWGTGNLSPQDFLPAPESPSDFSSPLPFDFSSPTGPGIPTDFGSGGGFDTGDIPIDDWNNYIDSFNPSDYTDVGYW